MDNSLKEAIQLLPASIEGIFVVSHRDLGRPEKIGTGTIVETRVINGVPQTVLARNPGHVSKVPLQQAFARTVSDCKFVWAASLKETDLDEFRSDIKWSLTAANKFCPPVSIPSAATWEGATILVFDRAIAHEWLARLKAKLDLKIDEQNRIVFRDVRKVSGSSEWFLSEESPRIVAICNSIAFSKSLLRDAKSISVADGKVLWPSAASDSSVLGFRRFTKNGSQLNRSDHPTDIAYFCEANGTQSELVVELSGESKEVNKKVAELVDELFADTPKGSRQFDGGVLESRFPLSDDNRSGLRPNEAAFLVLYLTGFSANL